MRRWLVVGIYRRLVVVINLFVWCMMCAVHMDLRSRVCCSVCGADRGRVVEQRDFVKALLWYICLVVFLILERIK